MEHQWYVLQVFSNYEHKVQRTLTDRIEVTGLQSQITDVVVPIEEVVELKGGEKKTTERKFFPGYMLVQMELDDDTWHLVRKTPNVMGFLGGTKTRPSPLTENELNKSLKKLDIEGFSLVFFVPAIKINFYIKHFKKYFTGRNIFIAREMTKKYETYYRQSVDNLSLFKTQLRGELTIVISQKIKKEILSTDYVKIENQVIKYLKSYTVKDVVELMSKKEKLPKKIIYNLCIKNKK